jgi:hypothetical protein
MHVPTTGLEVAREYVALRQLVEARDAVQAVLRSPAADDEPEAFRSARKNAAALDDDLVKRIPSVLIHVAGSPTQLKVDGRPVPLAALVAPFKLNPGHHAVIATAAGSDTRKEVDLSEGETTTVDIAVPAAPASAGSAHAFQAPVATPVAPPPDETATSPSFVPWLRWGGLGLAVVGAGVGTATGVVALGSKNSASKQCVNGMCPPSTWNEIDSARTMATVSTVAFCAAGAGAAIALVGFLIHPAGPSTKVETGDGSERGVAPWIGPAGAGIRGAF